MKPSKKCIYQNGRKSIIKVFQKTKLQKKRNYANNKNTNISDVDRERRKVYVK